MFGLNQVQTELWYLEFEFSWIVMNWWIDRQSQRSSSLTTDYLEAEVNEPQSGKSSDLLWKLKIRIRLR